MTGSSVSFVVDGPNLAGLLEAAHAVLAEYLAPDHSAEFTIRATPLERVRTTQRVLRWEGEVEAVITALGARHVERVPRAEIRASNV